MTVKQLIQILSTIEDQDVRVMVKGYEGGYNDVEGINIDPIDIALDVNIEWYYGAHERAEMLMYEDREKYQIVKTIIL
jgi:hypothetical protein